MQQVFDAVAKDCAWQMVAQIAPILQEKMAEIAVAMSDPDLTTYAERIALGRA